MRQRIFLIKWMTLAWVTLILGSLSCPTMAACTYFRTRTRIQRCEATQVNPRAPELQSAVDEFGESPEADDGRRIHLVCSCDYSLQGSDLRCDLERTEESEVLRVASDVHAECAASRKPCEDLCPTRWP